MVPYSGAENNVWTLVNFTRSNEYKSGHFDRALLPYWRTSYLSSLMLDLLSDCGTQS